ncbi:CheY-like receiver [Candidatus Nitrosarchaeum limnium SFB1]|jgi:CheY-like chemotaxis protein|uniref:CheY-like receiver n=1 Tax=Candidatus Nitrosarchaeum limnium SFB1 TaxID=886738 RepID=F3KJX5_9ARCH|nr:CheY-like receiver [Candidatus Nitrosarchaeum limnium SFB1]
MVNCIVIDDNSDIVKVVCELLEMIKVKVLATGTDGLQAVELYKKHRPNIIFIDLSMPKFDGFYAISKIREFDPNSKIVAVTADLKADEYVLLNSLKPNTILYKPFNTKTLMQTIFDILPYS